MSQSQEKNIMNVDTLNVVMPSAGSRIDYELWKFAFSPLFTAVWAKTQELRLQRVLGHEKRWTLGVNAI